LARIRNRRHPEDEERRNKRKAILAALVKATEDGLPQDEMPANTDETTNGYYILTQAEMEALISGDIQKIEQWVSNLDRRHAIWLLSQLIKESL